jgi:O-methyltransferase
MDMTDAYIRLLKRSLVDLLGPTTSRAVARPDGRLTVAPVSEPDRQDRISGNDWPANGMTMVGLKRLTNVQECVRQVIADRIPGDLIETGVWRGGTAILMRALLDVYDDRERKVWVADSFAGLPTPDPDRYPADKQFASLLDQNPSSQDSLDFLAVPVDDVRRNFDRYGYLDERVYFVEGWFKDTLPALSGRRWAVLRLDGDLYESTIQALKNLYPGLSEGGFAIVDDYGAVGACRKAVEDYRAANGIDAEIQEIDSTGIFWRKE